MDRKSVVTGLCLSGMCCVWLLLAGCGGDSSGGGTKETASSSVELKKDGSITEVIVEEFSKEYYKGEELKEYIISEVARFNGSTDEGEISVDGFEEKDGFIHVTLTYPSAEIYSAYNSEKLGAGENAGGVFFYGTVAEAYEKGLDLDVTLHSVKDGESIGREGLLGMGDSRIIISELPMTVKVFGKVMWVSDNVSVTGKNQAVMNADDNGEASGRYYIIF